MKEYNTWTLPYTSFLKRGKDVHAIGQALKILTILDHKLSQVGRELPFIRKGNKTRTPTCVDLIEVA